MNLTVLQVFYAVFSGVMEGLAIANELIPYGSPFLALFCLAPLYIALYKSKSYRQSFMLFFIQVLTVHLISSYWLANFHGFAVFTLGASAAGTAFQGGLTGTIAHSYPSIFRKEKKLMDFAGSDSLSIFRRIMWFSTIWVLFEYEKSVGAMGYPWGTISMASYGWKLFTQIADITGVYGITFIYVAFSGLFAEGILLLDSSPCKKVIENYGQGIIFVGTLFFIAGTYGAFQLLIPRIPEKYFNAVLVQQNVDPWESGDSESIEISKKLSSEGIERFQMEGKETDLVVWSEGVLGKKFPAARNFYSRFPKEESLVEFISKNQVPFLIGGTTLINNKKKQHANSAILFDRMGSFSGFYSKIQLVPFAEKIPFYDNAVINALMKKTVGLDASLTSGFQYVLFKIPLKSHLNERAPIDTGHQLFETIELDSTGLADEMTSRKYIDGASENPNATLSFTTPICFEDAFPTVCRKLHSTGSELFLNITNDSWSKTRSSEIQHFIAASYLAIEFRTTLVRCANSGFTAVLDPAGKILAGLPLFEKAFLSYSIPVYKRENTIYSRCGDWFVMTLALATCMFFIYVLVKIWFPVFVRMTDDSKRKINIENEDEIILITQEKSKAEKKSSSAKKKVSAKTKAATKKSSERKTSEKPADEKNKSSSARKKSASRKDSSANESSVSINAPDAEKKDNAAEKSLASKKSSVRKTTASKKQKTDQQKKNGERKKPE